MTAQGCWPRNAANGGTEKGIRTLLELGIPGLRYLDGSSRKGAGSYNYVIWDQKVPTASHRWSATGRSSTPSGRQMRCGSAFDAGQPFDGREVATTPLKPGTTTLMVDGTERPTTEQQREADSTGARKGQELSGGGSATARWSDSEGRPLVVYHGPKLDSPGNNLISEGLYLTKRNGSGRRLVGNGGFAPMSNANPYRRIRGQRGCLTARNRFRLTAGELKRPWVVNWELIEEVSVKPNNGDSDGGFMKRRNDQSRETKHLTRMTSDDCTLWTNLQTGKTLMVAFHVQQLKDRLIDGIITIWSDRRSNSLAQDIKGGPFAPIRKSNPPPATPARSPTDPDIRWQPGATDWYNGPSGAPVRNAWQRACQGESRRNPLAEEPRQDHLRAAGQAH